MFQDCFSWDLNVYPIGLYAIKYTTIIPTLNSQYLNTRLSTAILTFQDDFLNSYDFDDYHKSNLSCRFMAHLTDVEPVYFADLGSALDSVRRGDTWGVMEFNQNYSHALYERLFGIFEMKQPHTDILNSR